MGTPKESLRGKNLYELDSKVKKYEDFLNDKLKSDLQSVHKERDAIYKQIAEYMQLQRVISTIKLMQQENKGTSKEHILKTKVDLGCNFYCTAIVNDCSKLYVLIGYGYFLEMTLDEANVFVDKKIRTLTSKAELFTKDSAKIKAHIRLVMEGLRELQHLTFSDTKQERRDVF
ncbi:protein UXT-like [Hydractinia symbiolongicarpus]|uniref:protein UXT-like n=1 Tax=Hydractinia symbiolongicarpus TaxID=13093 RepID=UPI00254B75EF|nr:protein UXT-like [Hydractinia symbiolongicarpus]